MLYLCDGYSSAKIGDKLKIEGCSYLYKLFSCII